MSRLYNRGVKVTSYRMPATGGYFTYADALEIASTRLGRRPEITYVRDAVGVQVAVS